jgi:predicted nucleic acid-binding Zn ribbon protein
MTQFRKVFLSSKEEYSPEKRRQIERTAMVYLFAGLILLSAMVLLMIYDNAL